MADGTTLFGLGIDKNIVVASLKAVVSGVNRAGKRQTTFTLLPFALANGRRCPKGG